MHIIAVNRREHVGARRNVNVYVYLCINNKHTHGVTRIMHVTVCRRFVCENKFFFFTKRSEIRNYDHSKHDRNG